MYTKLMICSISDQNRCLSLYMSSFTRNVYKVHSVTMVTSYNLGHEINGTWSLAMLIRSLFYSLKRVQVPAPEALLQTKVILREVTVLYL